MNNRPDEHHEALQRLANDLLEAQDRVQSACKTILQLTRELPIHFEGLVSLHRILERDLERMKISESLALNALSRLEAYLSSDCKSNDSNEPHQSGEPL